MIGPIDLGPVTRQVAEKTHSSHDWNAKKRKGPRRQAFNQKIPPSPCSTMKGTAFPFIPKRGT